MMNYIWAGIMILSILFGVLTGRTQEVSDAVFSGGQQAIELCITLLGSMCLWSGLIKIADKAGITEKIGRLCRPFLKLLFPGMNTSSAAARAISMNMAANLLGLGNAATPLGLKAMSELHKDANKQKTATNHMVMFVVLNTASIQLIPTTIAALRSTYGAENPMDVMPAIWIASVISLLSGVIAARLLSSRREKI